MWTFYQTTCMHENKPAIYGVAIIVSKTEILPEERIMDLG